MSTLEYKDASYYMKLNKEEDQRREEFDESRKERETAQREAEAYPSEGVY